MRKLTVVLTLLIAFTLVSTTEAQIVKLWEKLAGSSYSWNNATDNNMRSLTYNPATNHLLVCSRTTAANVYILNAANGDSLGKLDMTGVAGGTYVINYVRATTDGAIYASNLALANGLFKLYKWANETAAPVLVFSGILGNRTGDIIGLAGTGNNVKVFASGSASTRIYKFTTVDGTTFTVDSSVVVTSGIARGGLWPMSDAVSPEFWVDGAGTSTMHISSTGAGIDTVDGGVLSSGWHNVAYFSPLNGKKYILSVGKNDATEGKMFKMYDVTTNAKFPKLFVTGSLSGAYVANTNATGDIAIKDNLDDTYTIYSLVTNNGFAAFTTNMMTIADAKEDLDLNNIPDRLNDTVTVQGVVFSPNYQTVNHSYYIWDGTGGIVTFKNGLPPVLNYGDIVKVTGKIGQYNGLTQLQPFDSTYVVFIDDSAQGPLPTVLTLPQYKANPEMYEGSLVAFVGLTKISGTWPALNSSATLKMKKVAGTDTIDVRIDSDTDIDGSTEPVWPKDLVGIATQFSSGGSLVNGYQIQPRYFALDFLPEGTVPVELTSFTASAIEGKVVLNWNSATETNNYGYNVERSIDGKTFTFIGFVKGIGTTTSESKYSFVDNTVSTGRYTYRLKQIDFDGTYNYSKVVNIDVTSPRVFTLSQNYPNPFNPSTTINFSLPVNAKVSVKLYDVLGKEIMTLVNDNLASGTYNYNVKLSHLSSGIYFYTLEASGVDGSRFVNTKKMSLLK